MKKIISIALTLIFMLSLTACGRTMNDSIVSDTESEADNIGSDIQSNADEATDSDSMDLVAGISADEAKKAALKHAGINESDVADMEIDLDRDNGDLIYKVNFKYSETKYDYDIDAKTGEVISSNKD